MNWLGRIPRPLFHLVLKRACHVRKHFPGTSTRSLCVVYQQDLVFCLTPNPAIFFFLFSMFFKLSLAGTTAELWSTCVVLLLVIFETGSWVSGWP